MAYYGVPRRPMGVRRTFKNVQWRNTVCAGRQSDAAVRHFTFVNSAMDPRRLPWYSIVLIVLWTPSDAVASDCTFFNCTMAPHRAPWYAILHFLVANSTNVVNHSTWYHCKIPSTMSQH